MIYDIVIEYLPGKKILIPDLLSRNYCKTEYNDEINITDVEHSVNSFNTKYISTKTISEQTKKDQTLSQILNFYSKGWPKNKNQLSDNVKQFWKIRDDLMVTDNIIYYNDRIIIPYKPRQVFLKLLHLNHNGIVKSKLRAKELFYWSNLNNEIENYILKCKICEKYRVSNIKEPLKPHEVPTLPFEKIRMDICTYRG